MRKIFLISILIFAAIAIFAGISCARPKHGDYYEYYSPCWAGNSEDIVYIKSIRHHRYHYGFIADISKGGDIFIGVDFVICRMNIHSQEEEEIIKFICKVNEYTGQYSFLKEADGKRENINNGPVSIRKMDCSPDGKFICFSSGGLHIVDVNKKEVRRLTDKGGSARFSPDGKTLLYQDQYEKKDKNAYGRKLIPLIKLIDVDGSNDRVLGDNASSGIWHPSGKKIGFYMSKAKGYFWTINVDGTDKKAEFKSNCYPSDWSPDGKYINFVGRFLDVQGKRIKAGFKTIPRYGRFSPDGLKMVGGSSDITFSKAGDKKETVLLRNYLKEY